MKIMPPYNIQEIEDKVIVACLKRHNWNRLKASKELGMPYRTLTFKVRTLKDKGFKIQQNPRFASEGS